MDPAGTDSFDINGSVSAACATASEAIARASLAINHFVREVRECRSELDTVSAELHSLDGVLDLLGYDAPSFPAPLAEHTLDVLDTCGALISELEGCVRLLDQSGVSRAEKKSRWLASRGHIDTLRSTLAEYKLVLGLAADLVGVIASHAADKSERDRLGNIADAPANASEDELATVTARIVEVARESEESLQRSVALARLGRYLCVLEAEAVAAASQLKSQSHSDCYDGSSSVGEAPDSAIDVSHDAKGERQLPAAGRASSTRSASTSHQSWEADMDEFGGELREMPTSAPPPVPPRSMSRMSFTTASRSSTGRSITPDGSSGPSPPATLSSPRTSFSPSSSEASPRPVREQGYCTPVTTLPVRTGIPPPRPHTRTHSRRSSLFGQVLHSVFENPRTNVPSPGPRPQTSGCDTPQQAGDRPPSSLRRSGTKLSTSFRNFGLGKRRPSLQHIDPETIPAKADSFPTAVFGVPLTQSIQVAKGVASTRHDSGSSSSSGRSTREYPLCVLRCAYHIRDSGGLAVPHIFGDEGDPLRVAQLKGVFNSPESSYGKELDWDASPFTVHDAAGLVLVFLSALPKPLIPESVGKRWISLSRQATVSGGGGARLDQGLDFWEEAMVGVRGPARAVFKLLLNLWGDVADAAEVNEMTAERLAGSVIRPLMHGAVDKKYTDYLLGLAFLIRKRSEYNIAARGLARKSNAAF